MAIADKLNSIRQSVLAIKNAIKSKGVDVEGKSLSQLPNAILDIQTGGGGASASTGEDVCFYDYDGTLLYAYTIADAQKLTALPALPSHQGLSCQGWNFTLAQVNATTTHLDIGASYITSDQKTHVYVTVLDNKTVKLNFNQSKSNGTTIDFGDGTANQTVSSTGNVSLSHTYASSGDYVISLLPDDDCTFNFGHGASDKTFLGDTTILKDFAFLEGGYSETTYAAAKQYIADAPYVDFNNFTGITKVEIGKNIQKLNSFAFQYSGLKYITIPTTCTNPRSNVFKNCRRLRALILPIGTSYMGSYFASGATSLKVVSIPPGMTSLQDESFKDCRCLKSIVVPDTCASIGHRCFSGCNSLEVAILSKNQNITYTGVETFSDCTALRVCKLPPGLTSIPEAYFHNCYALVDVEIPNACKKLCYMCFNGCEALQTIDLKNVEVIQDWVFRRCVSLRTVNGTSKLKETSFKSFSYCPSLLKISLPALVHLGGWCFQDCNGLQEVDFSGCTSVPTYHGSTTSDVTTDTPVLHNTVIDLGHELRIRCYESSAANTYSFYRTPNTFKIKVPSNLVSTWKTRTGWSRYSANIIGV